MTAALAAALLIPASAVVGRTGPPDPAGSGTLPLRGLDLDALTIPVLQQRMDAGT